MHYHRCFVTLQQLITVQLFCNRTSVTEQLYDAVGTSCCATIGGTAIVQHVQSCHFNMHSLIKSISDIQCLFNMACIASLDIVRGLCLQAESYIVAVSCQIKPSSYEANCTMCHASQQIALNATNYMKKHVITQACSTNTLYSVASN